MTDEAQDPGAGGTAVDFWFDPVCPWTWTTARWLTEVRRLAGIRVRWRVMSLEVLNEGLEVNPEDPEGEWGAYLRMPVRVCAAVAEHHGPEALGRYYAALAVRLHERGEWDGLARALDDAGLPGELAAAAESEAYDAAVRASHAEGVALVGPDVGSPVLAVTPPRGARFAFFGPVVSPAPRGGDALRLWDGLLALGAVPGLYEIKRTRTREMPSFD
ncbi:DsbA family protein [Streptomyces aculeolatus]|uniref:DsbA family protein n=1 Tax=Streptomyces aculeolatus TaxID=270689 RepID=UPI001CECB456|nr:DsbA family protein [Streptomyces aculeolatus]